MMAQNIFLIIIIIIVLINSSYEIECRCDSRMGFGNICGHRLGLEQDGCNQQVVYFCDHQSPNGLAHEVTNCRMNAQNCIFGWVLDSFSQDDVCAPPPNYTNITEFGYKRIHFPGYLFINFLLF